MSHFRPGVTSVDSVGMAVERLSHVPGMVVQPIFSASTIFKCEPLMDGGKYATLCQCSVMPE